MLKDMITSQRTVVRTLRRVALYTGPKPTVDAGPGLIPESRDLAIQPIRPWFSPPARWLLRGYHGRVAS